MKKIFISYSHKDEEWKDRVNKHLQVCPKDGIPLSKGRMVKREENLSFLAEKINDILAGTAAADETLGSTQQSFHQTSFGETKQPKIELLKKELANKNLLIKKMTAMNEVKAIGNAVESYITENYKAPQAKTMEELRKQLEPLYIMELPLKDPWGKPYQYRPGDTDESEYTITCTGSENKIVFANGNFLDKQ